MDLEPTKEKTVKQAQICVYSSYLMLQEQESVASVQV